MSEKTFIKITNREIWDSLQALHTKIDGTQASVKFQQKLLYIGGGILTLITMVLAAHIQTK